MPQKWLRRSPGVGALAGLANPGRASLDWTAGGGCPHAGAGWAGFAGEGARVHTGLVFITI